MGNTLQRTSCEYCHSSDNVCHWEYQGKTYSKCKTPDCEYNLQWKTRKPSNDVLHNQASEVSLLTSGSCQSILDRRLTKEICELYQYQVCDWRGKEAHIANYYDKRNKVCAQKIRLVEPKEFFWNGDQSKVQMFGAQTVDITRPVIYVTEGEIDCLSLAQEMPLHNVVSIRTGAGDQTAGEIIKNKDFLMQFETIIFAFDNDEIGKSTASELCKLFPPKKAGLLSLRYKDINEYLKLGKTEELREDTVNYKLYVPECLRQPTLECLMTPEVQGVDLPYPQLNKLIKGIKPGRLYTLMAGSGIGKSSFTKELVYHIVNNSNMKAGLAYLEEAQKTSGQSFIALDNNIPLHELEEKPNIISKDDFKLSYVKYIGNKIWLLNASFMKLTGPELMYNLNFLVEGKGCNLIVLDHVTMITYDMGGENSERKDLDILMKNLRQLVHRLNISIIVVTHLKRPQFGKAYDEGREVHMSDARSSGAIEQLSDVMIALERNMISDYNNKTRVKVLKNRITGQTGYVDELSYISNTGRLIVL